MDNQRPDQFDRYFDEEDELNEREPAKNDQEFIEQKPEPEKDEKQDYFDESLFTEHTGDESLTEPSTDIDQDISIEKPSRQIENDDQESIAEDEIEEPSSEKDLSPIDYEDSKMQKINIKPLLIGATLIIFLVGIVFVLYKWVFVPGEEEVIVEKEPIITPQEKVVSEAEKKKISFLKTINSEKNSKLGYFSNISDLKIKEISYSSILLYGNSFSFEIFGSSRDDIARFNLNLKKTKSIDQYEIINTSIRPGSKGGVFALYKSQSSPKSRKTTSAGDPKIELNIQEVIKNLAARNSLTLTNDRSVSRKTANQFDVLRMEYIYRGSETNCSNFLKSLAGANNNFNVHKISLQPTNQRNFSKTKFQLLIVLDFYV